MYIVKRKNTIDNSVVNVITLLSRKACKSYVSALQLIAEFNNQPYLFYFEVLKHERKNDKKH